MRMRPRPIPFLAGMVALYFVAQGFYHLLEIGSCSSPPSDGLPACPPGSERWFFYMFGGLVGAIVAVIAGGGVVLFYGLFATIGGTALYAGTRPDSALPKVFYLPFALGFLLPPLLPFVLIPFSQVKQRRAARLVETGVEAIGTVLAVDDTGVTINQNPRVRLRFRIEALDGRPPYEATKTVTVSRLAIPRAGDRYPVWFDPADPQRWAFGTSADSTATPRVRRLFELAGRAIGPTAPPPGYPAPGADPFASPLGDALAQLRGLDAQRAAGAISPEEFARRASELLGRR
jgi:hypothetical protein